MATEDYEGTQPPPCPISNVIIILIPRVQQGVCLIRGTGQRVKTPVQPFARWNNVWNFSVRKNESLRKL